MISVSRECGFCGKYAKAEVLEGHSPICPHCQKTWPCVSVRFAFDTCPFCQCRQFYVQKDFNQALGCLIMAFGIILVPLTYGISLPVFALVDWILYRKVPTIVVCYRCAGEFRGFSVSENLKSFMHHIGEKYEKERESKKG